MRAAEEPEDHAEPTGDRQMEAIVQDSYGDLEVLHHERTQIPEIGSDEVLVRVHAAGIDQGVWHLVTGLPYPVRLAGYGLRAPKNPVPGSDLAGRVEAVGAGVQHLSPGDAVFGIGMGAFAEYARASPEKLAAMPDGLSFEEAATVPISGLAALQAVRDQAEVQAGQEVLVVGASGGVGSFAVQIAHSFGARVTGVAGTAQADLVRSLGADDVIDYRRERIGERDVLWDAIIDTGGNRPLGELRSVLAPRGTLVIVGGETDGRWLGGTDRQLRAMAISPFVSQRLRTFISSENRDDLAVLGEMIEAGSLAPTVSDSYPLNEVPAAIRRLREGQARGKLAIRVVD